MPFCSKKSRLWQCPEDFFVTGQRVTKSQPPLTRVEQNPGYNWGEHEHHPGWVFFFFFFFRMFSNQAEVRSYLSFPLSCLVRVSGIAKQVAKGGIVDWGINNYVQKRENKI